MSPAPILPPEESHRAGIPLIMAIEARIAATEEFVESAMLFSYEHEEGRLEALRECLALAEATSTISARLAVHEAAARAEPSPDVDPDEGGSRPASWCP